jgi:hypothetical protein
MSAPMASSMSSHNHGNFFVFIYTHNHAPLFISNSIENFTKFPL